MEHNFIRNLEELNTTLHYNKLLRRNFTAQQNVWYELPSSQLASSPFPAVQQLAYLQLVSISFPFIECITVNIRKIIVLLLTQLKENLRNELYLLFFSITGNNTSRKRWKLLRRIKKSHSYHEKSGKVAIMKNRRVKWPLWKIRYRGHHEKLGIGGSE